MYVYIYIYVQIVYLNNFMEHQTAVIDYEHFFLFIIIDR